MAAAQETEPQVALGEAVGEGEYVRFWRRGEFNAIKHSFYKRFSASHKNLMSS